MKSTLAKQEEQPAQRKWHVVDAAGVPAGRLAVRVANVLRGKDKPTYTPHVDTGDFVIVINAEQVKLSGRKEEQKIYKHYTGWFGGLKEYKAKTIREKNPKRIVYAAVKGMLPKTKLAARQIKRLKVYVGSEHPHNAQQAQPLDVLPELFIPKPRPIRSRTDLEQSH